MTRLILILALVFQSLWSAAGGVAALCDGQPALAGLMSGSGDSAGCCSDSTCSCCVDTRAVCGCGERQTELPATPMAPSSKDTTVLLMAAPMESAVFLAHPGESPQSPIEREAPLFQSHNQKHASLCVWRT